MGASAGDGSAFADGANIDDDGAQTCALFGAKLFAPTVRQRLRELSRAGGSLKVTELAVEVERPYLIGELWTAKQVTRDLNPCLAVAKALDQAAAA